jgi:hypothetical protein
MKGSSFSNGTDAMALVNIRKSCQENAQVEKGSQTGFGQNDFLWRSPSYLVVNLQGHHQICAKAAGCWHQGGEDAGYP